jgi:(5-formylfuran-3-yl)methyl phosphate synthase
MKNIAPWGLLVSVRSAAEAEIALAGGAALIDVKEPSRGALGRADDAAVADIVRTVAGRRPVSAALGELADGGALAACRGLRFVKWGLASCRATDWRAELERRLERPRPQTVIVAYADWQCAQAPTVEEVVTFACRRPGNVLLIDTHCKDAAKLSLRRRPTLLDWLAADEVIEICERCRGAGVRVALAGSIGQEEIEALLPARPDWFAVRGAACADDERGSTIQLDRVRALVKTLEAVGAMIAD